MQVARIAAAAMLAAAAYAVWSGRQAEQQAGLQDEGSAIDGPSEWLAAAGDTLTDTVAQFTGAPMQSTKYAAALNNAKNAEIINILSSAEGRYGIPAGLLVRQAWQESRFNPAAYNKISGAKGLMQFLDATAAEWGVTPYDAESAANGAARYMLWLYGRVGTWPLALAAYNWGIGNLIRKGMAAAPLETRNYLSQILGDVQA